MDAEDAAAHDEEGKDAVPTINMDATEDDDDEDNFGKMLSSRGLNFQMPADRRATYSRTP